MRKYEIKITDSTGKPKVITAPDGTVLFNGTWSSTDAQGKVIPGALNIEFEIQNAVQNMPIGGSFLRVYGIGLPLIGKSANFNPSFQNVAANGAINSAFLGNNITISGGFAKGLPLANPNTYGIITQGQIYQAFGNWQGISQTIDFMLLPQWGSNDQPFNLVLNCQKGAYLQNAIEQAIKQALPAGTVVNIAISPNLKAPQAITNVSNSLPQFARYLNQLSAGIVKTKGYAGIQINYQGNVVTVDDYSGALPAAKNIPFTDFIGQPTWIAPYMVTFKTVLNSKIQVGDIIQMPAQFQEKGLILTVPQSLSQYKQGIDFQGKFRVQSVRHLGMFRNADANSWVTVYQAYKQ